MIPRRAYLSIKKITIWITRKFLTVEDGGMLNLIDVLDVSCGHERKIIVIIVRNIAIILLGSFLFSR